MFWWQHIILLGCSQLKFTLAARHVNNGCNRSTSPIWLCVILCLWISISRSLCQSIDWLQQITCRHNVVWSNIYRPTPLLTLVCRWLLWARNSSSWLLGKWCYRCWVRIQLVSIPQFWQISLKDEEVIQILFDRAVRFATLFALFKRERTGNKNVGIRQVARLINICFRKWAKRS